VNCVCHNLPLSWTTDKRMVPGGWWQCPVRRRENSARSDLKRRDLKIAQQRERYDADPVYRIGKNLHDHARKRRDTIERRRVALASDEGA
jgi:hypothetical protein